jgi:4-aminobutyrate aminotransferase
MGERFMERLRHMQADHPSMGDVRGMGLMIGIELVKDKDTREPAGDLRDGIVQKCFEKGLIVLGCGMSTVRFMPALNVTADLVDEGLEIFEEVLTEGEGTA